MQRWIIFVLILIGWLGAEPFVYGSSGLSNKQVKRNKTAIHKLHQETASLREQIEGLSSIIEGLNQTIGRLQRQKGSGSRDKKILTNIANLIDKINQDYVSKAELQRALKSGQVKIASKPSIARLAKKKKKTTPKSAKSAKTNNLAKASSSALYSKGVRLVGKKRYTDAKRRFDILASRGYKKAATHFYLGEIAYRTSHYSDAVEEYKQSAELDENAGYMDRLLLHTALAFEKTGDKEQAKRFFKAIVDEYPGTSSAKAAKKHL
jgi:TolA-binding protein